MCNNSLIRYRHWFKLWIIEGLSIRFLCKLSGYSKFKLQSIKNYWLQQTPAECIDYSSIHYLVFDGTYFHKDGCLLSLMDAVEQQIVSQLYVKKESFREAYPWFTSLKSQGLNPAVITTDGEQSIIRAIKLIWPGVKLQRCLYHIQHEGMRWLRTHPKTEAGRKLRSILAGLSSIKTSDEQVAFIRSYLNWKERYAEFVLSLPRSTVAFKDLKRTMALLDHALPDMFHYLSDSNIHSTTNALESFHSRLKADYRRHRGLTKEHRIQYLHWYRYFKNIRN